MILFVCYSWLCLIGWILQLILYSISWFRAIYALWIFTHHVNKMIFDMFYYYYLFHILYDIPQQCQCYYKVMPIKCNLAIYIHEQYECKICKYKIRRKNYIIFFNSNDYFSEISHFFCREFLRYKPIYHWQLIVNEILQWITDILL